MAKNRNDIASANTINNLVKIARNHFSQFGYDKTSLEAIVKEAGMTRGAVYHHFKNKKSLFIAVLEQVQKDVGEAVNREAMKSDDLWEQLILGCIEFVETATRESNRRILLIDALNVVDWGEWKKLDDKNSVSLLIEQLGTIKSAGQLVDLDINMIAHLISGGLNELTLNLAESHSLTHDQLRDYVYHLVKGFKIDGN